MKPIPNGGEVAKILPKSERFSFSDDELVISSDMASEVSGKMNAQSKAKIRNFTSVRYAIAPSILSADFSRLGEDVTAVLNAGADWIHVDVMDNHFVPNLTMGPQIVKALRDYGITATLDVHLMIEPVAPLLKPFADAGADFISFHVDAVDDIEQTIASIRELGCKPGVVFNPDVPLGNLSDYLEQLDLVLIMSVQAGFGGQCFMPEVLEKVKHVRQLINNSGKDIRLEIDGGINQTTIAEAANAGADTFVAGSAIFKAESYQAEIAALRSKIL